MTRTFFTTGKKDIIESEFELREPAPNEIQVKTRLVGVCRSDVDMFNGDFYLPPDIQGHEGLGEVVNIGAEVDGISLGSIVATNADNCFADRYNAPLGTFVEVPEISPKYILEPVACAINILQQLQTVSTAYNYQAKTVCIIGSGFLSRIISEVLADDFDVNIIGRANAEFFLERNINQNDHIDSKAEKFDVIIDLKDDAEIFNKMQDHLVDKGIYVVGAKKNNMVSTNFEKQLWGAVTYLFPSPRGPIPFEQSMKAALEFVNDHSWVGDVWTHKYDRNDEILSAFEEPCDRSKFTRYGRGYIKF